MDVGGPKPDGRVPLLVRGEAVSETAPQLFLGRTGKPVCRSKARKLILRYGRAAGIEGVRLSPHTLRHTFAVLYVRNGGDSFSLQEILGHSTLEMTRQYVNLARRDVAEQHKKFSPMQLLAGKVAFEPKALLPSHS
jgi:integrase/recombinase XerD